MTFKEMIRKAEVKRRTSLSNTALHELRKSGKFPEPGYLSERVPVWDSAAVDKWVAERLAAKKPPAGPKKQSVAATKGDDRGSLRTRRATR